MQEVRSHFTSSTRQPLAYRQFNPASSGQKPRGQVVLLHGWGDHGGRYIELTQALWAAGFTVFIPDFAGHGLSPGARAQVHDFQQLVADLGAFLTHINPQERLFLCGHSMGGCLAFHFALLHPDRLHGVIFNSAALTINPKISALKRLIAKNLGSLWPSLPVSYLKNAMMMSQLPAEQRAYDEDTLLYHGKIDAGSGKALMLANHWVNLNMAQMTTPFLALQGDEDVLVNPQGPELLMEKAPVADKTLQRFQGMRHDLLHEPVKMAVIASIVEWLTQRT